MVVLFLATLPSMQRSVFYSMRRSALTRKSNGYSVLLDICSRPFAAVVFLFVYCVKTITYYHYYGIIDNLCQNYISTTIHNERIDVRLVLFFAPTTNQTRSYFVDVHKKTAYSSKCSSKTRNIM